MKLHEAQKKVVQSKKRFRVLLAGRRFGKTVLAIEEMLFKAVTTDKARIAYIAPTYQAARDISWAQLKERAQPLKPSINESRLEITVPNKHGTQSLIVLRSWDSVETLRGQYFDFLVLDEVAQFKEFDVTWQQVLRPTLTDRKGACLFISTPLGFNHFYDLYNTDGDQHESFHFTSYDNPHLPVEEIDDAKEEMTEDSFAQEYLADFRKQEGLVYKEFSRDRHIFDDLDDVPENVTETLCGIDFGYTNPAAVLKVVKDFDATYWVTYEWYRKGKTDVEIAEHAMSLNANAYYPDPENPGGIKEMENRGLSIRDVIKGKGSVEMGIDRVRELFKSNRLKIHKDCVNLISELESYRYEEKRPDKNEPEKPVKENDHALDALRYVVSMNNQPEAPMEQDFSLYEGEFV